LTPAVTPFETRFGTGYVVHDRRCVLKVILPRTGEKPQLPVRDHPAAEELERYMEGEPVNFSEYNVRIPTSGVFGRVLRYVKQIPYGDTMTYGEVAEALGTHPRVVGMALSRNETPVLVPCHRVVSKEGLGGFRWGREWKRRLLRLERSTPGR